MNRQFLTQFLNKISEFPQWVKEIIYLHIGREVDNETGPAYVFAAYKPVLSYKGRCELDFKKSGFDSNIYNILDFANRDYSISEITLNTYLSLEEIAKYFLFCVDEGYFEFPDDSQVLSVAGFLTGKLKTGEYFLNAGKISEDHIETVIENQKEQFPHKKFGQALVEMGLVTELQLMKLFSVKQEAKKRFILDHNEVPEFNQEFADVSDEYKKQIEDLKLENSILKKKLEQLLTMVKKDDD